MSDQQQANQSNILSIDTSTGIGYGGIGGSSGSLIGPGFGTGIAGYTYQAPSYTWTQSIVPNNELKIRKVENGYILIHNNKEYVLTGTDQLAKYLKLLDQKV